MYLENATKTQDPVVTMVLCHDTEVSLNQARKATKTAEDQAKQEGIANAFSKLGNLLESRGHRTEAQAMLKKAKKLGGSVAEPVRQASTARPTSMATIMGNILDTSHNQKRRDSVMIPAQVFAENRRLSAMEFKPPEPDKRLNDTAQLACSLSLLQSPDDVVDPNARQWVLNTKGNQDEQERLKLLSTDLARTFKRDELKDPKAVAEVVYLTPVLGQSDFKHLLREFTTGIEHSSLLDNNQLEGLAQLLQNAAYPNYLDASELNKILVLINTRPRITHGQSQAHLYQLTLTISHVLDAIADIKVVGLNREMLAESLRTYLEGLMGSSDPYLVFQAAYAYQALQYIPDNDTLWKAALKRTARVQGISALMITTKGSDLNGFIEALGSIQQESAEVTFKSGYDNPTSLVESGQSFLACLKEGHSFTSKRAWYSALRGADSLLRDGQITEFKKVVCEASCRSDPAFQWGVCLRLNDLASNTMWDTDIRQGAIVFLGEMYRNDSSWGQYANIKQWILSILTNLSTHIGGEVQGMNEEEHGCCANGDFS
ncbi:hypothetical protein BGX31_002396 [Mortierella sp. GBA43]|nr:hypothetical protein BGX31_002396 [Mortierella sp. GBA43]